MQVRVTSATSVLSKVFSSLVPLREDTSESGYPFCI